MNAPVRGLVTALTLVLVALVAACSGGPDEGGEHNDADVMFASMMIPHHEQAVTMSDLVLAKADLDPDIATLAREIKTAQQPEITTMQGWLDAWGEAGVDHDGMDHGGMGAGDGMLSDAELTTLESAGTAEAERLFLAGMQRHHEGAIAMARTEIEDGRHPGAVGLARTIVETQQAEIETIRGLATR